VHRADLLSALLNELKAELRRGVDVTDIEVGDHVNVLSNVEPLGADLLVGADGIRSRVREALGLPAKPRQSGYVAWRGVAPNAPAGFSADTAGIVVGAGRHGGWVPVGGGRVYWFLTGEQGETPDPHSALDAVRGWIPDSHWGTGPVTLAGDAAHAMLPSMAQGANQALEDAAALLSAVRQHGMSPSAFRAYEVSRQERTARLVRMSRQIMPVFQWRRTSARWLRAALLALPQSLTQWQLEWLYWSAN